MLYQRDRFTLPTSTSKGEMCKEKGHSAVMRGRCICCGEKIAPTIQETQEAFDTRNHPKGEKVNRRRGVGAVQADDAHNWVSADERKLERKLEQPENGQGWHTASGEIGPQTGE